MTLNPTLKSILARTAHIVGSLTIYYIPILHCLDYLDFHYWSDGGLIDGASNITIYFTNDGCSYSYLGEYPQPSRPNIRPLF